jgi:hypothetical protein
MRAYYNLLPQQINLSSKLNFLERSSKTCSIKARDIYHIGLENNRTFNYFIEFFQYSESLKILLPKQRSSNAQDELSNIL